MDQSVFSYLFRKDTRHCDAIDQSVSLSGVYLFRKDTNTMVRVCTLWCHGPKCVSLSSAYHLEKTPNTVMPRTRRSVSPWVAYTIRQEITTIMVFCFAVRWNSKCLKTPCRLWTRLLSFYCKIAMCVCFLSPWLLVCVMLYVLYVYRIIQWYCGNNCGAVWPDPTQESVVHSLR